MPTSVPMMPDAGALQGTDWLYLIQGMNLDRDRKVSLGLIREFMSERGADLEVVNIDNASPGPLSIQTVSVRDLVILVQGDHTLVTELQIAVEVPPGAVLTIHNGSTGPIETVAGNRTGLPYTCDPPFGTFGRYEVVELTRGPAGWMCQHTMDRNLVNSTFVSMGQVLGDHASRIGALESFSTAAALLVVFPEVFGDAVINLDNGTDILLGDLPAGTWMVDGAIRYGVPEGTAITHAHAMFVAKHPTTGAVLASGRVAGGSPTGFRAHIGLLMNGATLPRDFLTLSEAAKLYIRFECFGSKDTGASEPICICRALATHQPT